MELKNFFAIFVKYKVLFWSIIVVAICIGIVFYFLQTKTYKTTMNINITRNKVERTNDYNYDYFYRLKADEMFTDTIVQWIQTPYAIKSVFSNVNTDFFEFSKILQAKRLSTQTAEITFVTKTESDANIVAHNIIKFLNKQTQKLNTLQNQDDWFVVLSMQPVTEDNSFSLIFLLTAFSFVGFFIAFWVVLLRHYIAQD